MPEPADSPGRPEKALVVGGITRAAACSMHSVVEGGPWSLWQGRPRTVYLPRARAAPGKANGKRLRRSDVRLVSHHHLLAPAAPGVMRVTCETTRWEAGVAHIPSLGDLPAPPPGRRGWPWTEASPVLPPCMPDGRSWPRVSIVTPSFNQGAFLEQTLRSVLLQGYPSLEYFVIDGGSSDDSLRILERYGHFLSGWVSEPDRGQSHAINKGFHRAQGEVLGWVNSDDFLLPAALGHVAERVRAEPDAAAWVGRCRRVDGVSGRLIDTVVPRGLERDSIVDWGGRGFFYQPSCFFSARAWHEAGPLDEELQLAMDLDLWIRLAKVGPFVSTDQALSVATRHDAMKTQADRTRMHAETAAVQIRHGYLAVAVERLDRVVARGTLEPSRRRLLAKRATRWVHRVLGRFRLKNRQTAPPWK